MDRDNRCICVEKAMYLLTLAELRFGGQHRRCRFGRLLMLATKRRVRES
ncbi:hypothetical protein ACNKHN_20540 [Shigella flexneri]